MIDQRHNAPRRYFVDAQGHRVLIGLSLEETAEFEALDVAATEEATAVDDVRWLDLYSRHEAAWRVWIAQSQAKPTQDLGFVNYV